MNYQIRPETVTVAAEDMKALWTAAKLDGMKVPEQVVAKLIQDYVLSRPEVQRKMELRSKAKAGADKQFLTEFPQYQPKEEGL